MQPSMLTNVLQPARLAPIGVLGYFSGGSGEFPDVNRRSRDDDCEEKEEGQR
jgi:hypothetical protein